jgi:hypothetical protein
VSVGDSTVSNKTKENATFFPEIARTNRAVVRFALNSIFKKIANKATRRFDARGKIMMQKSEKQNTGERCPVGGPARQQVAEI